MFERAASSRVRAPAADAVTRPAPASRPTRVRGDTSTLPTPHTLPIARSSMRAIAQGAPPPTYMGGRLGRDTLPSRGLLSTDRTSWSCLPITGRSATRYRSVTDARPPTARRPLTRSPPTLLVADAHPRRNGGDAPERGQRPSRRPARPPALDLEVESPALDR